MSLQPPPPSCVAASWLLVQEASWLAQEASWLAQKASWLLASASSQTAHPAVMRKGFVSCPAHMGSPLIPAVEQAHITGVCLSSGLLRRLLFRRRRLTRPLSSWTRVEIVGRCLQSEWSRRSARKCSRDPTSWPGVAVVIGWSRPLGRTFLFSAGFEAVKPFLSFPSCFSHVLATSSFKSPRFISHSAAIALSGLCCSSVS